MVLFRITENEPSKMRNVRPYVYSRPWLSIMCLVSLSGSIKKRRLSISRWDMFQDFSSLSAASSNRFHITDP